MFFFITFTYLSLSGRLWEGKNHYYYIAKEQCVPSPDEVKHNMLNVDKEKHARVTCFSLLMSRILRLRMSGHIALPYRIHSWPRCDGCIAYMFAIGLARGLRRHNFLHHDFTFRFGCSYNLIIDEWELILFHYFTCSCQKPRACPVSWMIVPTCSHPRPILMYCCPPLRPTYDQHLEEEMIWGND